MESHHKFVENLWIFSKNGTPIIEIFHNTELDSSLLGLFLAAIDDFSKKIGASDLKSVNIGDGKFILTSCLKDSIYLVGKCNLKVKDKVVRKIFKIFTQFFEELYTVDEIVSQKWDSDLAFFDIFKDRIDLYFKMSNL